MSENTVIPKAIVARPGNRIRASGPILILATLFVAATFLAWYFTWFGRGLSDAEITKYLSDTGNPRHVQHALLQIQQRIERGDLSNPWKNPGSSSETAGRRAHRTRRSVGKELVSTNNRPQRKFGT